MGENDHLGHPGRSMMITIESDQEETYYMLHGRILYLDYFTFKGHYIFLLCNTITGCWHFDSGNSQVSSGYCLDSHSLLGLVSFIVFHLFQLSCR